MMKLKSVQIKNFRSIEDSEKFDIGNITCLVGKNESGKTAVLQAIEGINSYDNNNYDKTRDYPRRHLNNYDQRHPNAPATVCISEWELQDDDIEALEEEFGEDCIENNIIEVTSRYKGQIWKIDLLEKKVVSNICKQYNLNAAEKRVIEGCNSIRQAREKIDKKNNPSSKLIKIRDKINTYRETSATYKAIDILSDRMPKFLYFSHYFRMSGALSIDKYREEESQGVEIRKDDQIFLDFLKYAGTSIDEIENASSYEEFKSKLEAASNSITDQIFEYWTQNQNLEIEFDVGQGRPDDPSPYNKGTIMRARVKNQLHRVSVPFSERSAGFIWFFSFLVFFSQVKKNYSGNLIILLDEPGLTLHAKAQRDLLKYIEDKLLAEHQVLYTTHSPFMIIPDKFNSIRTVEDIVSKEEGKRDQIIGTKVSNDFLRVNRDTVFPLQNALGYEISQTLFISKHVILVEGPSDMLYLNIMSQILEENSREGLNNKWILCPAGGIDKIAPFIRLYLARGERRNIVALTDYSAKDSQKIKQIEATDLAEGVLRISDFCEKDEADIEDLFDQKLYLEIVHKSGIGKLKVSSIDSSKRIVPQIETIINGFSHYQPSYWLLENLKILRENNDSVSRTLEGFEKLFSSINEKFRDR